MIMNKSNPKPYRSELIENLIHEIGPEEQESTDRKMLLAARIHDAMKAKGMKKGQLAEVLGKRPSEITKWLSGTHNFTIETLWEIGDVLGTELINLGNRKKEKVAFVGYGLNI
jgi:ribosome-binding protein aMBF1 (putative translation factor)